MTSLFTGHGQLLSLFDEEYDEDQSGTIDKFNFPSTLSSGQRKIIHERASSCGLFTLSQETRYHCV